MHNFLFITLYVSLLFSMLLNGSCSAVTKNGSARNENYSYTVAYTDKTKSLEELIPQSLFWIDRWGGNVISCPEGNPKQTPIFAHELYSKYENQNLTMLTKERDQDTIVDLVEIKTRLQFPKIQRSSVLPPLISFFCESQLEKDGGYNRQNFLMPRLKELVSTSKDEKFDRLLSKIIFEAEDFVHKSCTMPESEANVEDRLNRSKKNPLVKLTIPRFSVGDPEIYVLAKGENTIDSNGFSILWFRFIIDSEGREIDVTLIKNFGRPEETKRLVPLIKRHIVKEITLPCPDG